MRLVRLVPIEATCPACWVRRHWAALFLLYSHTGSLAGDSSLFPPHVASTCQKTVPTVLARARECFFFFCHYCLHFRNATLPTGLVIWYLHRTWLSSEHSSLTPWIIDQKASLGISLALVQWEQRALWISNRMAPPSATLSHEVWMPQITGWILQAAFTVMFVCHHYNLLPASLYLCHSLTHSSLSLLYYPQTLFNPFRNQVSLKIISHIFYHINIPFDLTLFVSASNPKHASFTHDELFKLPEQQASPCTASSGLHVASSRMHDSLSVGHLEETKYLCHLKYSSKHITLCTEWS